MIISQHGAKKNILTKIATTAEESQNFLTDWLDTLSYAENDIVNYNGTLYKSLTGTGNLNKIPDAEASYWEVVSGDAGGAGILDVIQLEGYGLNLTGLVGDSSTISITSALSWCNVVFRLRVSATSDAEWTRTSNTIGAWTVNIAQSVTSSTKVMFYPSATWPTGVANYADVPTGFYWYCLPGVDGDSFKVWYDRDKIEDAFKGETSAVIAHIDQAGCVWKGDPESGGTFVCGPTMEDGFGLNTFNIHSQDVYSMADVLAPMGDSTDYVEAYIDTGGSDRWAATSTGIVTFVGSGGGGGTNLGSGFYFWGQGGSPWTNFADVPTGMYYLPLPYHDGTQQTAGGTKIAFWYDRDKYIKAFRGLDSGATRAYVDQLGNIWKGVPGTGTFVCGPYEGTPYVEFIAPHGTKHTGTEDEIDGDKLDVDFTPANYTPDAAPAEADDVDDLAAHLKGIDTALASAGGGGAAGADGTILDGETETTIVITGAVYNRAAVSNIGANGGQRQPFIKSITDDATDTTVVVAIDSSYTEDIDVHIVLANE